MGIPEVWDAKRYQTEVWIKTFKGLLLILFMKRIQVFVEEKTFKKIDKKRGDVPMSLFCRKELEKI